MAVRPRAALTRLAILLAGCAVGGRGGAAPTAPTPPPRVDDATYRAAVTLLLDCMRRSGYEVTGPVVSPLDGLQLLRSVAPPDSGSVDVYNARLEECERKSEFAWIEPAYLEQHTPVMASRMRPEASRCLAARGVTPTGRETTYTDFVSRAGGPNDLNHYVTEAARRLYPDLPEEIIVFYQAGAARFRIHGGREPKHLLGGRYRTHERVASGTPGHDGREDGRLLHPDLYHLLSENGQPTDLEVAPPLRFQVSEGVRAGPARKGLQQPRSHKPRSASAG